MVETQENMAWNGKKRTERVASLPPLPEKRYTLTGRIPDFKKIGMGVLCILAGILAVYVTFSQILPELNNLNSPGACQTDCILSKLWVTCLEVLFGFGGVALFSWGIGSVIAYSGAIFENTIEVSLREKR